MREQVIQRFVYRYLAALFSARWLYERIHEGEAPAAVIALCGFNRTTIYKWIHAAVKGGDDTLRSTPATGQLRILTPAEEQQVFRSVNDCDPRQYGLDFGLRTRAIVAQLIERKFWIKRGLTPRCGHVGTS